MTTRPTEIIDWNFEADKIISAHTKYKEYHAMLLRHTYENGRRAGLMWAELQIVPDGNPQVAIDKIHTEILKRSPE